ncbi:MAG: helix-hairpin-helix domain-containing protein [Candidatus Hydrogenedentes bacterium]|nr:helix-hairpin-helix domain-containing protein [Candidatus Hydrogenedentota bacterium]
MPSAIVDPEYRHLPIPSPSTEQAGTPPAVRPPANVSVSLPGVPLNINQASSEQLQKLPGIGPAFAARIINERSRQPFMSVEELKRVSGIGDKRLETVRPFITAP